MQRTDTGIVQTRRDTVRLDDLPVLRLHHIAAAAMQHAGLAQLGSSGTLPAMDPLTRRFDRDQLHASFVQEMIKRPGRIAAATHTGDDMRRQLTPRLFLQLSPHILADDTLEPGYHIGIRMRPHDTADDIMRVDGVVYPIPDGFIGRILQGLAAAGGGYHRST